MLTQGPIQEAEAEVLQKLCEDVGMMLVPVPQFQTIQYPFPNPNFRRRHRSHEGYLVLSQGQRAQAGFRVKKYYLHYLAQCL